MTSERRDLLILAVFATLLFVPWLGARDLWNPNEPLYGRAVVEMAERGDALVPTVNGVVFDEKPILYFWLALGTASALGGVDELTLRLPSAAAGVASVLLLYGLVLPYVGRRTATISGLLLATTFVVFWSARQVQMDLLLSACTLGAVLGSTRAVDRLWSPLAGWGIAGIAAGLGLLAKGPVGLLVPALVVVPYAAVTGRVRALVRPSLLLGAAGVVAVGAPWYLLLWARGETAYLEEMLVRQNLLRFVDPWDHEAPWWYYLRYFWIDMAPWAWFVPLAWGLTPRGDRERRLRRLAWCWFLALIVFFSLSSGQRSPYILPIAPAVAVLVAGVVERWLDGGLGAVRAIAGRVLVALLGIGFVAGALGLAVAPPRTAADGPALAGAMHATVVVLGLAGLAALGGAVLARGRRTPASFSILASLTAVYVFAAATALPAADAFKSHRPFCEAIRSRVEPGDPLRGFHAWRWRAGYSYYTGRSIPNLESVDDLRAYWSRPERVYLIVERGELEEARKVLGSAEPLEACAIGSNFAYLFSNRE